VWVEVRDEPEQMAEVSNEGLPVGAIVGIVIGCLLGVLLIALIIYVIVRRKKNKDP